MIDKKYVALRAIEMQQIKFYSCACFSTLGDIWFRVGVGDNCAILDFSQRHLTGHSWTYLRFCRIFFRSKLPPRTAKTVFANPKGPPFGC